MPDRNAQIDADFVIKLLVGVTVFVDFWILWLITNVVYYVFNIDGKFVLEMHYE